MINIRIGNLEYHVNEASDCSAYTPVTDHSLPELSAEELQDVKKVRGPINRIGYASYQAMVPIFAQRIKELEEQLNAKS